MPRKDRLSGSDGMCIRLQPERVVRVLRNKLQPADQGQQVDRIEGTQLLEGFIKHGHLAACRI